jgi:DNA-binding NarL/FixJ family response regulator
MILVVDDHPVVRAGLRALLEGAGLAVVAEASGAAEALDLARRLAPRVIVVDFDLAPRLLSLGGVRVVVLTTFETPAEIARVLAAGAAACVAKDAPRADILRAVRG